MRLIGCLTLTVAAVTAQPAAQQPSRRTPRPTKQYTIEQFLNTTSIPGASFSPDESRILFSSSKTGIWNAYTVATSGGWWTAVTTSTKDSTFAVSYFPHDARVLVTRDQGGNELNHLFVIGADGVERDLAPGGKLKAAFAGWTHDGAAFHVVSNERDARAPRSCASRRATAW